MTRGNYLHRLRILRLSALKDLQYINIQPMVCVVKKGLFAILFVFTYVSQMVTIPVLANTITTPIMFVKCFFMIILIVIC